MITNEYYEKVFAKSFYPLWDIWTETGGNGIPKEKFMPLAFSAITLVNNFVTVNPVLTMQVLALEVSQKLFRLFHGSVTSGEITEEEMFLTFMTPSSRQQD